MENKTTILFLGNCNTAIHSRCFVSFLLSLFFFKSHLTSPLILFLFLCSLAFSSFLWKVEVSSIQVICTLCSYHLLQGKIKRNAVLLLLYMICVGLFPTLPALRSDTMFPTSCVTPQVSNMCICAWWVFNKRSWLIYWLLHSKKTMPHFSPKKLESFEE